MFRPSNRDNLSMNLNKIYAYTDPNGLYQQNYTILFLQFPQAMSKLHSSGFRISEVIAKVHGTSETAMKMTPSLVTMVVFSGQ